MSNSDSRVENILNNIISGKDASNLKPPQSRIEWLLMKLNEAVGKMDDINLFHICEHGEYDAVNLVPIIQNPQENLFYLVPSSTGDDKYTEWVYTSNGEWEKFGNTSIADISSEVSEWLTENVDPSTGYVVDKNLSVDGAAADAKVTGDAVADLKSAIDSVNDIVYAEIAVDFSTASTKKGYIQSNLNWSNNNNALTYFVPVIAECEKVIIKSGDKSSVLAFLLDDVVTNSTPPNYCTGTSRTTVDPNNTVEMYIPTGCTYIAVMSKTATSTGFDPDEMNYIVPKTIVQIDETFTEFGKAADAKKTGDQFWKDVNGLSWTIGRTIGSDGSETSSETYAVSNSTPASQSYLRYGGYSDSTDVAINLYIHEYNASGVWLRRTRIDETNNFLTVGNDCSYVRFSFGRASSTHIAMTDTDITNYFMVRKFVSVPDVSDIEINNIKNALFGFEFVTPPVVNICGGIEQNFYYQNMLMGFNTKKAYCIDTSAKTTNFDDFARLSPSVNASLQNNGFKVRLYPYNKNGVVISDTISYNVVPKSSGSGLTKKILLIGDSLTFNQPMSKHLVDDLLTSDVMTVSLIGTLGTAPYNREGRSGWSAHDYVSGYEHGDSFTNAFWNPSTEKFDFSYYMSNNGFSGVDYVFINLGTNLGENTVASMTDDLEEMVTSIHAYDSSIRVGVWTPPPRGLMGNGFLTDNDNTLLRVKAIINKFKGRTGERIYIVPVTLNVDPYHDFPYETVNVSSRNSSFQMVVATDRTHPADAGYWKMADVIYNYIKYFGSLDAT